MLIGDAGSAGVARGRADPVSPLHVQRVADDAGVASDRVPFGQRLASVDRTGDHLQLQDAEAQGQVRLSPDGRRLARQRIVDGPENPDIWVDDLDRGTILRTSSAPTPDIYRCGLQRQPTGMSRESARSTRRARHQHRCR